MKILLAATAFALAFGSSAFGFDGVTQDIVDRMKSNKLVSVPNLAALMGASARWCYREEAGSCAWSDIYLAVADDEGAQFEMGNAWDETVNIVFTSEGVFKDNRYFCETGDDWVPSVRAVSRADGTMLTGRALYDLKATITANRGEDVIDCFDYLFLSADEAAQTVTLLQRQYTDEIHDEANDVEVKLHFDADKAAALTWRW